MFREIDLVRAQFLGEILEGAARIGVGFLPHWRTYQRKARRNRRRLDRTDAEAWRAVRPRIGIGGVLTDEDIKNKCKIFNRTSKGPDMVQLSGKRERAGA